MKIKFHNDDLGLTWGFTEAIKDCHLRGVSNSTSVRVNGTNFNRAVKLLKNSLRKIEIGIHLNLTDGPTCDDQLAGEDGKYKFSFVSYLLLLTLGNKKLERLIAREFELQYRELSNRGIRPVSVDSQDHIHMIPQIFEIACKFCQRHKIKKIRLVREPFYRVSNKRISSLSFLKFLLLNYFAKINTKTLQKYSLQTTDAFYGVLYTNRMDSQVIMTAIGDASERGFKSIEVLSHPAYINTKKDICYTSKFIATYANLANREIERKALIRKSLLRFLRKHQQDN